MKQILLFLLVTCSFAFSDKENPKTVVSVNVEGIKTIRGNLAILVFNNHEGFPDSAEKAVLELKVKVTSNNMIIDLGKLPYGNYAVALIHDANSNNIFDKNFIGIPKELFGFTNVEKVYFGPPSYKEASFQLNENEKQLKIKMIEI